MVMKPMLAATGLLLLALPGTASAQPWSTNDEYPKKALRERRDGTTYFNVTVGTDGKSKSCTVTQSSGHADLDEAACGIIMRRGRWEPATNNAGEPIEAVWSSKFRWVLPR